MLILATSLGVLIFYTQYNIILGMQPVTVSELTSAIKSLLEPAFKSIVVKGEISNFKLQASGHLYFSLKDSGAQISSVLFRDNANAFRQLGEWLFMNGIKPAARSQRFF